MYYYTKRNFNESLVFYCVYTTGVAFDRLKLQRIAITTALFFFFFHVSRQVFIPSPVKRTR